MYFYAKISTVIKGGMFMRQISNLGKFLFIIGLFVVGVAFIVINIIGVKQANTWPGTTGEIQSIELIHEAVDDEDTDEYEVMVKYTVDGKTYVSDLGVKLDDFEVGQVIDILYNPEAPEAIVLPGAAGSIIGIVIGVAAVIGSIIMFLMRLAGR